MGCYCHTCKRGFLPLGIARHRAMHRDKKEDCKISYSDGYTYEHNYSRPSEANTSLGTSKPQSRAG